jgi:hypothetical protein
VSWKEKVADPGMYAYMDRWGNDLAFAVSFEADLDKQHPEIDPSAVREYVCVQYAKERREVGKFSKTLTLVVEQAEGGASLQRVGLVAFDYDEAEGDAWERRALKPI